MPDLGSLSRALQKVAAHPFLSHIKHDPYSLSNGRVEWGQASVFRLTEVVRGWTRGTSRRNAEDASGACCPGGGGMEVGKGQQAQARRNHTGAYHLFKTDSHFAMRRGRHARDAKTLLMLEWTSNTFGQVVKFFD